MKSIVILLYPRNVYVKHYDGTTITFTTELSDALRFNAETEASNVVFKARQLFALPNLVWGYR